MARRWLSPTLRLKLRTWFRREAVDRELDDEVRYHIDRKTELLISQGLPPVEARFAALRAFGGVEKGKEECRDARGWWAWVPLERLIQDLRHGSRQLTKHPGFALIAILSMAIGVGANAAMFSVADGLILRPLAVPDPGGVIAISTTTPDGEVRSNLSYPDYVDLRDRLRTFDGLAAMRYIGASLARTRDELAQGSRGLAVSANLLDVLRVPPALGRAFAADDDRVGRVPVVILAHEMWMRTFGGDPRIIGRQVFLSGMPATVIGVTPEAFTGPNLYQPPDFYVPLTTSAAVDTQAPPDVLDRRDTRVVRVLGRLKVGVSLRQAAQDVDAMAVALQREHPATNHRWGLLAAREMDARLREYAPAAVMGGMLLALAVAVLLVGCANVAGLLTGRAPVRAREIAVRLALGGSRARLIRQLITESLLIAGLGGAVGLALAYGGIRSFQQFQYGAEVGVRFVFALDRRALIVALAVAALSALLASVVPAWRSTRTRDLSSTLRNTMTPEGRTSRLWGRHGLVAVQIALTLVVLTMALSFYRAFDAEYGRGPGFRIDGLLLTTLDPGLARQDVEQSDRFYRRLTDRIATMPQVTSVALTSFVPLNESGRATTAIVPEGFVLPKGTDSISVASARVGDAYFDTVGIPIIRGRPLQATDTADSPRVAVVSRGLAARFWPGGDPIGKRLFLPGQAGTAVEIVGVAADIKFRVFTPVSTPFLYLPWRQQPSRRATVVVRTTGDASAAADPMRAAILDTDRGVPILAMQTMAESYQSNAQGPNTVVVRTIGGMGVMGLWLALIGLYGLTAFAVRRRTREIGIRMAVGAPPPSMLRMILRQATLPAAAGVVLGAIASVAAGNLVQAVFPGTGVDAVTVLLVVPGVVAVVVLAAYVPARRAAGIDPLMALRHE